MTGDNYPGPHLLPGTPVRHDGSEEYGPEHGVVVHCWLDDQLGYDCYVAFFGHRRPSGRPEKKPYVLRYLSSSLTVLDPAANS